MPDTRHMSECKKWFDTRTFIRASDFASLESSDNLASDLFRNTSRSCKIAVWADNKYRGLFLAVGQRLWVINDKENGVS